MLLAGAAYGSFVAVQQLQLLNQSCVKPSGFRFEKIGLRYARLVLGLRVINKTDIDFTITNEKFDVYLNGAFVSSIRQASNKPLLKNTPVDLQLLIEFDPLAVLRGAAQSMIQNQGNVLVQLKGRITVRSKYLVLNNIKINESFSLAEIMKPGGQTNNNCE